MITQLELNLLEKYLSTHISDWMEIYRFSVWFPFKEGYLYGDYESLEHIKVYRKFETILGWDFKDLPFHINDFPDNPLNKLIVSFRLEAGV